jgi:hypothetical protein
MIAFFIIAKEASILQRRLHYIAKEASIPKNP